jgi:hypothetical protein
MVRQLAAARPRGAEERPLAIAAHRGRGDVGREILVQVVMGRHLVQFAALLMRTHPAAALLDVEVLDPHAEHGADPGEGVGHQRYQGAITLPTTDSISMASSSSRASFGVSTGEIEFASFLLHRINQLDVDVYAPATEARPELNDPWRESLSVTKPLAWT